MIWIDACCEARVFFYVEGSLRRESLTPDPCPPSSVYLSRLVVPFKPPPQIATSAICPRGRGGFGLRKSAFEIKK